MQKSCFLLGSLANTKNSYSEYPNPSLLNPKKVPNDFGTFFYLHKTYIFIPLNHSNILPCSINVQIYLNTITMSFLKKIFGSKKEPQTVSISYADFWQWFMQNEKAFYNAVKENDSIEANFFNKLSPKLEQLNKGYYFVTGMCDEHTAELVFTAEGKVPAIVCVEDLVNTAPAIQGWKFTALKPAMNISDVEIKMANHTFNKDNISFYSNDHKEYPDQIDITIVHNDYNESTKNEIVNGTYIFLDNALGELNFASIIDDLSFVSPDEADKELVPISKLNDFLIWREKEFIEKYEGSWYSTETNNYSLMEAKADNGNPMIAIMNTDLLKWDAKASHPWMLIVELKYDGSNTNGMPDKATSELLNTIEDEIIAHLKDSDGYLNVGRQTFESVREIYFACKEFRKPSRILSDSVKKYSGKIEMSYDIFKDKYWMSLNRFHA